ncbi:hypothetical protein E2C01_017452 [Portunus trituberculatus]|uniref:Uncharacterized protein n=1 Tax=Portunus trituberculatus TaxID=210409 RepID=A0A5B7DRW9_PORTR|nr:hypothetical protein [Portunus trituberculatus]
MEGEAGEEVGRHSHHLKEITLASMFYLFSWDGFTFKFEGLEVNSGSANTFTPGFVLNVSCRSSHDVLLAAGGGVLVWGGMGGGWDR